MNTDEDYTTRLNKYICCFASSVYIKHFKDNQIHNIHAILLKVYEILASGSLLLCPKSEEPYLNEIGLFHKQNMFIIDMNNIDPTITFILSLNNRNLIDSIRKKGHEYAKNKLNSKLKYIEIKDKLNNLCM